MNHVIFIHAGYVYSGDGDDHCLNATTVARCYRLRPSQCVKLINFGDDECHKKRGYKPEQIIDLYPLSNGDYEQHLGKVLKEKGITRSHFYK